MADLRQLANSRQHLRRQCVGNFELAADLREQTARAPTRAAGSTVAVAAGVKIGAGPAEIADCAAKRALLTELRHFRNHGFDTATAEKLTLMQAKSAKTAAAGTAAHHGDRIPDHRERRDLGSILRMRLSTERQRVDGIEFGGRKRQCRRLDHEQALIMRLHQRARQKRVLLLLQQARKLQKQLRLFLTLCQTRQLHGGAGCKRRRRIGAEQARRAANAGKITLAAAQTPNYFDNCRLAHAIDQQIGFGIGKNARAQFILPVIIVRDPAQARFNTAENNRQIGKGAPRQLTVNNAGIVWPQPRLCAGSVAVARAPAARRAVVGQHAVKIAGRDAAKQPRPTHCLQRLRILPWRLRNNADAQPLRLQHARNHSRAKCRMVNVGIASDQQHIKHWPVARLHFTPAHGQWQFRHRHDGSGGGVSGVAKFAFFCLHGNFIHGNEDEPKR